MQDLQKVQAAQEKGTMYYTLNYFLKQCSFFKSGGMVAAGTKAQVLTVDTASSVQLSSHCSELLPAWPLHM